MQLQYEGNMRTVSVSGEAQRPRERQEERVLCWVGRCRDRLTENGGVRKRKTEGWTCPWQQSVLGSRRAG